MREIPTKTWTLLPATDPPDWLVKQVGPVSAQLFWLRGIRTAETVAGLCQPSRYSPKEPWAFTDMERAVDRLLHARDRQENVTIWGDFDADGVTATAVLLEGLGQFVESAYLNFYIPNRLTESHGVSAAGVERLHKQGTSLIVTCDTGSTSLEAISTARQLGVDVIITDHHTLPAESLDVVATINPRQFEIGHPLATLSGVAVAYKLVEALYLTAPDIPERPLSDLLDLVAIGLVADLVELKGDVRYLTQLGIEQLKKKARPAVEFLLDNCKRAGDRAMDIAFGVGPRINAVSRIHGDASFCVQMLVGRDRDTVKVLVDQTELANTRRKGMQAAVKRQASEQLETLDLSTNAAIVLASTDWPAGVLGIVAGEIARDYHRPTFVFRIEGGVTEEGAIDEAMAVGSARSVDGIDLYDLLNLQQDVLHSFGGHPLAAGLRLSAANLPLLQQRLNHTLRHLFPSNLPVPELAIDLDVTVSDLGQSLFRQLRQLEPFGMGNPIPRLLLRGVKFDNIRNRNSRDSSGQTVRYIYTTFTLRDRTSSINGIWWGHPSHDLPQGLCDAVVELDYMSVKRDRQGSSFAYQVRLIDVRPADNSAALLNPSALHIAIDLRGQSEADVASHLATLHSPVVITDCPASWTHILSRLRPDRDLVLAYQRPIDRTSQQAWRTLVGWAKSLLQIGVAATVEHWSASLQVSTGVLEQGIQALAAVGFQIVWEGDRFSIPAYDDRRSSPDPATRESAEANAKIAAFQQALAEEDYLRRYFYEIDAEAIAAAIN
ncbi:MAG: single-stranded-DNA-specific exonuclease RecJ [Cyanobacteria bacterium P01_A01_bin.3]